MDRGPFSLPYVVIKSTEYDAIVVGSGPNGLAAAIRLRLAGLSVLVLEGKDSIGGGTRTAELTLPGFLHDICSAIHPLAAGSPFLKTLPLGQHGLEYISSPVMAAHPLDDGRAAALYPSLEVTASTLGEDADVYRELVGPLVSDWPKIVDDVLGPFGMPANPLAFVKFGIKALPSATRLMKRFTTAEGRALVAGMAAHSMQPLTNFATSAIALVLMTTSHVHGWPFPKGGSRQITGALASYLRSLGGKIETNFYVRSLTQLPSSRAVLFDVTPRQLLEIAGHKFSSIYRWQLERYRYGTGVFKIDWALDGPVPFVSEACRQAATIHIGNTFEEIADSEAMVWKGQHQERPFALFAQQSIFDATRAPDGKHVAWAYCHVPLGSRQDMTERIERQVERYAPGFRDLILARHTFDSHQLEVHNPNYIGGDIAGGANDVSQLFTRPALRSSPYRTSAKGLYICSSATPPGGGVHGMCGVHAADRALKDIFENSK